MTKRSVLLLVARPESRRDETVSVGLLLVLRLHFLLQLRGRSKTVDYVDPNHLHDVGKIEALMLAVEDVAPSAGVDYRCLHVRLRDPVRNGELRLEVALCSFVQDHG